MRFWEFPAGFVGALVTWTEEVSLLGLAAEAAGAIPMTDRAETAAAATRRLTNMVYLFVWGVGTHDSV